MGFFRIIPVGSGILNLDGIIHFNLGGVKAPYASGRDWNKVEKFLEKEADEKKEGEAALNEMFQKIYADANDEVHQYRIRYRFFLNYFGLVFFFFLVVHVVGAANFLFFNYSIFFIIFRHWHFLGLFTCPSKNKISLLKYI